MFEDEEPGTSPAASSACAQRGSGEGEEEKVLLQQSDNVERVRVDAQVVRTSDGPVPGTGIVGAFCPIWQFFDSSNDK